jgi:hypothetical protein
MRGHGRVAQLVRALASHARGPGFESLRAHLAAASLSEAFASRAAAATGARMAARSTLKSTLTTHATRDSSDSGRACGAEPLFQTDPRRRCTAPGAPAVCPERVALARCSRDPGRRCNCAQRGLRIENGFEKLRLHKPQAHGNRCAQPLHAGLTDWAIHRYKAARQRFAHSAIVTAADRPNIAIVLERLSVSACVDCNIADPLVLQFDDVQSKPQLVSFLVRSWCSPQRLMDELRTCDVRCANCQPSKTAAEYFTCWLLGVGWRRDRPSRGAGYRRAHGDIDGVAQSRVRPPRTSRRSRRSRSWASL